jgi:hypothetical protein
MILDEFLRAIGLLSGNEIKTVLQGPRLRKKHKFKGAANHSWEAVVINHLYRTGHQDEMLTSQASAVRRCADDSDLPGLISLLEQLEIEYVNDSSLEISSSLITAVDNIRTCFIRQTKGLVEFTAEPQIHS